MKKIIAISVMFALIAVAAFADTSIGGEFGVRADLAVDKNQSNRSDAGMGNFAWKAGKVTFSWEGENTGGKVRLYAGDQGGKLAGWEPPFAFGWWKPIDQLKIQFGKNPDGNWGTDTITGWGFNGGAQDFVALDNDDIEFKADFKKNELSGLFAHLARGTGFGGGFGEAGLALFITPADGIEIGIGIPLDKSVATKYTPATGTDPEEEDGWVPAPAAIVLSNTTFNVKADIPNIGTAKFALALSKKGKNVAKTGDKDGELYTNIFVAFYLTAIENMGVDVGLGITTSGASEKKNDQIQLGIGYTYSAGDLGLKARIGVMPKWADKVDTIPLGIELLPYYNLGSLTAYLNVGFGMAVKVGKGESASDYTDFYFNPYVQVPVSGGNFWAGIRFWQASKIVGNGTKPDANWSIPIGLQFYF